MLLIKRLVREAMLGTLQMVASIVKAASGMSLVVAKVVQMFALSLGTTVLGGVGLLGPLVRQLVVEEEHKPDSAICR